MNASYRITARRKIGRDTKSKKGLARTRNPGKRHVLTPSRTWNPRKRHALPPSRTRNPRKRHALPPIRTRNPLNFHFLFLFSRIQMSARRKRLGLSCPPYAKRCGAKVIKSTLRPSSEKPCFSRELYPAISCSPINILTALYFHMYLARAKNKTPIFQDSFRRMKWQLKLPRNMV